MTYGVRYLKALNQAFSYDQVSQNLLAGLFCDRL